MGIEHMKGKFKKWNIILTTSKGFIEETDTNVSFNIFSGSLQEKTYKFVRSCYRLETAKRTLAEL